MNFRLLAFLCAFACAPASLWAVPDTINFQGRLLDDLGIPVTAVDQSVTVRIYDASSGGSLVYSENHTVDVDDGVYSLVIGAGTGGSPTYGANLFNTAGELWLEIQVGAEVLSPRHQLLSAPFSVNAHALQGNLPSDFATPADVQALQTQLKDLCIAAGGGWSDLTSVCTMPPPVGGTLAALPSGNSFVPLSTLNTVSGPDACPENHYHGFGVNCNNESVPDPNPTSCGHGTVSQVVQISAALCVLQ